MNKNVCPSCANVLNSPVWNCMKGHIICTKCCKKTSVCPTCVSSTINCNFCDFSSIDIISHFLSFHSFEGPFFISNDIKIEVKSDDFQYSLKCIYKRYVNSEEKAYAFCLTITDGVLSAVIYGLSKSPEQIHYRVRNKSDDYLIIFQSKTSQDEFNIPLQQIRDHFLYVNTQGIEVFCLEVEFGDEVFYI